MLVDLARNDVNRVCDPLTTRVDKLMVVQKVWYPVVAPIGSHGVIECSTWVNKSSFRMSNTWFQKFRECCDLARRDSTPSAPSSLQVRHACNGFVLRSQNDRNRERRAESARNGADC
jgi:hypothetical protein